MTKDAKYSIVAVLGAFVVLALLVGLELAGADLAGSGREWFQLVLWTGFVFGIVAYVRGTWLAKIKGLLVFFGLLIAHIVLLVWYFRLGQGFPNVFFLFFAPVEAALVALVVGLASGRIGRRKRPAKRSPHSHTPTAE
jgi:hypothetical protein